MSNLTRLLYFNNNISWSLENFLKWSIAYAGDFGNKDNEHRIYKTYLEMIYNDPNLLTSRDNESQRNSAEEALKNFEDTSELGTTSNRSFMMFTTNLPRGARDTSDNPMDTSNGKEANSVQVAEIWKKSSIFTETLNTTINLNANKMVSRVAELHDDFSDTIFSVTKDQLRFERKQSLEDRSASKKTKDSGDKMSSSKYNLSDEPSDLVSPVITPPPNPPNFRGRPSPGAEVEEALDEIDDFFRGPPNVVKDAKLKSRKRGSMKGTGSKSVKRNKSSNDAEDAEQTTCDESDVEENTTEKAERSKTILSWEHVVNKIKISDEMNHDWLANGYNISKDFRDFQASTVERLKNDPTLSYSIDIDEILCLSSIIYVKEDKPKYLKCSEQGWQDALPKSLVSSELPESVQLNIMQYSRPIQVSSKLTRYKLLGCCIKCFSMDIPFDGLYRFKQIDKMLLPTENANFLTITPVIESLYSLMKRVDLSIDELNRPSTPTGLSYHRDSNSSPRQVRIPVLNIPPPVIN
ncbi:hypothetical protein RhiirA1_473753 [Rhizophagus irregularis]|uniref:Uncharacterized protein n=1 Tax=Rhizophagus irregularis TaxID=588596 RepID=A0A2N0QZX6_9GLOM|nr:hypothetical protein RhiirA1_473753 [Rhizophagus irregularis]